MITKEKLKELEKKVRNRFLLFRYETVGEKTLTKQELKTLKDAGLIRANVKNFSGDAFALGKIINAVGEAKAKNLNARDVMKLVRNQPMTSVEEKAIEWANEHAGQYIQGIEDDLVREIGTTVTRSTSDALRAVQDGVADAIKNRKTISELKTALHHAVDNKNRDWKRVAMTEMQDAIQHGVYNDIRENSKHGSDQLVFKRPSPDACKHCKRVYLEDDGITPKIFKMSQLTASNIGKKAAQWGPTIGPVHPHCQCQLSIIPDNFGFKINEDGAAELVYTGVKAKPSIKKSLNNVRLSEEESECRCEY